jgi:predicted phosphodiesterase
MFPISILDSLSAASPMDPDLPYRTELLQNVRRQVDKLGNVEALLVGGDIAYHGLPDEYLAASAWLRDLAKACGCPIERVFVIPGNHDVNRKVITANPSVRNVQQAILRAEPPQREMEFIQQVVDIKTGNSLLEPLDAYNHFAAEFNCQIYATDKLFWSQFLDLDQHTRLRIFGLTSTLLSGAGAPLKIDDSAGRLYLSPLQTALNPLDGVVNLIMCHHPPEWFMDHNQVETSINERAAIQLFGHRHLQRVSFGDGYIRFNAGAVNPDRHEPGWEPGFNLIRLNVIEQPNGRYLDVEGHLLTWQSGPGVFRRRITSNGEEVFRHRVRIRGSAYPIQPKVLPEQPTNIIDPQQAILPQSSISVEASMSDERTRQIIYRFWRLASSQRRKLAFDLGIIGQADMVLPEPERYGRALVRAAERGLLERLAEEVERVEGRE